VDFLKAKWFTRDEKEIIDNQTGIVRTLRKDMTTPDLLTRSKQGLLFQQTLMSTQGKLHTQMVALEKGTEGRVSPLANGAKLLLNATMAQKVTSLLTRTNTDITRTTNKLLPSLQAIDFMRTKTEWQKVGL